METHGHGGQTECRRGLIGDEERGRHMTNICNIFLTRGSDSMIQEIFYVISVFLTFLDKTLSSSAVTMPFIQWHRLIGKKIIFFFSVCTDTRETTLLPGSSSSSWSCWPWRSPTSSRWWSGAPSWSRRAASTTWCRTPGSAGPGPGTRSVRAVSSPWTAASDTQRPGAGASWVRSVSDQGEGSDDNQAIQTNTEVGLNPMYWSSDT